MSIIERGIDFGKRKLVDHLFDKGLSKFLVKNNSEPKVLMYHGVDDSENKSFNLRHVGKDSFEKQLKFYKENFNVLSLEDFFLKRFPNNGKKSITLTFDDGYRNNYTHAFPLLQKYQLPATMYVTGLNQAGVDILWPDYLDIISTMVTSDIELGGELYRNINGTYRSQSSGSPLKKVIKELGKYNFKQQMYDAFNELGVDFKKDSKYDDYWKLMSDEQIVEMSKSPLITIGSHGYWHNNLGNIRRDEALMEVKMSKDYLENLIQKEVTSISYPDGSYSRYNIVDLFEIGFKYQLAVEYMFVEDKADKRILDRHEIYPVFTTANLLSEVIRSK